MAGMGTLHEGEVHEGVGHKDRGKNDETFLKVWTRGRRTRGRNCPKLFPPPLFFNHSSFLNFK